MKLRLIILVLLLFAAGGLFCAIHCNSACFAVGIC